MSIEILECVALTRDLPEHHLKQGDVGAVVERHGAGCYEVEFVTGGGQTQALVALSGEDIRTVGGGDILAVRAVTAA